MTRILFIAVALIFSSTVLYADSSKGSIEEAEKLFLEGKYDRVIDETGHLIDKRSRQRDELYYLKGLSELKTKKFRDARNSFGSIISRYFQSKRLFDAYVGIGDSYFLEGDTSRALRAYNEALDKFPKNSNIVIVNTRIAECGPGNAGVAAATAVSGEQFYVQVGCFKSRTNAQKLSKKLSDKGYESYVELPAVSKDNLYRVKVGRLKSKEEAEYLAYRLKKDGYPTRISSDICQ